MMSCSIFSLHATKRPKTALGKVIKQKLLSRRPCSAPPVISISNTEIAVNSAPISIAASVSSSSPVCHSQSAPITLISFMAPTHMVSRIHNEIPACAQVSAPRPQNASGSVAIVAASAAAQRTQTNIHQTQPIITPQRIAQITKQNSIAANRLTRMLGHF